MNLSIFKNGVGTALRTLADNFSDTHSGTSTDSGFMFSFGDPTPILDSNLISSLGTFINANGDYWVPPVDQYGLADLRHVNPYHGPILGFKRNMLLKWFVVNPLLSFEEFKAAALDYVVLDNCYFQKIYNGFGRVVRLKRLPAVSMRPTKKPDTFVQVTNRYDMDNLNGLIYFQPGEVIHLKGTDIKQGIFGIPDYLGGIQSALLGENSILFKRRFFLNGAHTGNIFLTHDAGLKDKEIKMLEDAIIANKGVGNFRSIYLNVPKSSAREPVKVIPVGQTGTADEFKDVQNITQSAMLAMHRMPPEMAAVIPANTGGFGDRIKVMQYYHEFEVEPLQQNFLIVNSLIGEEAIQFSQPDWSLNNKTA